METLTRRSSSTQKKKMRKTQEDYNQLKQRLLLHPESICFTSKERNVRTFESLIGLFIVIYAIE